MREGDSKPVARARALRAGHTSCICALHTLHMAWRFNVLWSESRSPSPLRASAVQDYGVSSLAQKAADTQGFEWAPVFDRDVIRCRNLEMVSLCVWVFVCVCVCVSVCARVRVLVRA